MPSPSSTTNTCSGQIFRYGPTNLKKGHLDSKINCYVASKGDKQTNKQASEQASERASEQASKRASEQASKRASEQASKRASEQARKRESEQASKQANKQCFVSPRHTEYQIYFNKKNLFL